MIVPADPAKPTTTASHVAAHAATTPHAIAVVDGEQSWTFAELSGEIDQLSQQLRKFSLNSRATVAVEWDDPYTHWAILLALESLGLTSATFTKPEVSQSQAIFDQADLVLSMPGSPPPPAKQVHVISPTWLKGGENQTASEGVANLVQEAGYPVGIIQGTGTTGSPKTMLITARAQEYRILQNLKRMNIGAETRYLLEMAFNVAVEFYIATACLRAGGTCIWDRSRRVPDAITHHGATHAALFVGSLAQNIRHLPTSFTKPAGFTIRSFGGPLIAELRTKTLARLADTVIESYGTNEVPAVADMAPDGTGDILSDVSVEIIDEDDNPVIGVAGTIRIQSPYMVTQYLNDPSASQERFRDGWFYPGDYGVMPEPGKLQVLGRTDDLLNIHGIKLHPANLEAQVAEIDDVAEAAITSLTQTDGGSHVCVCLVLEPDRKPADVIEAVSAALPPIISEASVIQVTLIPKTKNGKIQRRKLDELLLEAILSQADDAP